MQITKETYTEIGPWEGNKIMDSQDIDENILQVWQTGC